MNTRRNFLRRTALLIPVMLLPACAAGVGATSQSVAVLTSPPGAACAVDRAGTRLGVIAQTPGTLQVTTSGNDLTVTCAKAGFQTSIVRASPSAVYGYPPGIRLELAGNPAFRLSPVAGYGPHIAYPGNSNSVPANVLPDPVGAHAASY